MNIEQLGSLGEFIAAIATLATLVYLTVQIRQNTKQLRFSNAASLLQGMARISRSPDAKRIRMKIVRQKTGGQIFSL